MKRLLLLTSGLLALVGCSKSEQSVEPEGEKVAVTFTLPGVSADVSSDECLTGTRAAETDADVEIVPLDEHVTVRVVVYQRTGANADIATDKYITDATYVTVKEDERMVLKPCAIGSDGTVTVKESERMQLRFGTYDFYAVTPALALDADHRRVDVNHGVDYATSLTGAIEVKLQPGGAAQQVTLTHLERKCSRLHFSISRSHQNIVKAVFNSVKVGKITKDPVTALLHAAIATGDNTGEFEFPTGTFAELNEESKFLSVGASEVLPKSKAAFELAMNVAFNDGDPTDLKATVPEIAFAPGFEYCFNLRLNGDMLELRLQVLPWNEVPEWDATIGNPGSALIIIVGTWEVTGWNTSFGGQFTPVISTDSWTEWSWDTDNVGRPKA
ncbi:MAG: BF2992 family fimbrillin-A clan protein [Alistipes sp.]|nr:BF2992 family fimbrillin-A clan protein [Alistipes sp.]